MEREHWQLRCAELKQRGAYLYKSKIWADCEFQLDQVTIKAHKLIMAMASPVFSKMLYGGRSEDPVPIYDIRVEIFKILLEYIYSDTLNISSSKDACELYHAAKRWRLPFMAEECVKYLNDNMSPANVCHIYCVACENNDEALRKACEKVFCERTKEVLSDRSFNKLNMDVVAKLFTLDPLNIDNELDLYLAAVKYAHVQDVKESLEYRSGLKRGAGDGDTDEENETNVSPPPKKPKSSTTDENESGTNIDAPASPVKSSDSSSESESSIPLEDFPIYTIRDMEAKLVFRPLVSPIRFLTLTPQQFAECPSLGRLLTVHEILALSMNICSRETNFDMPEGLSTCLVPRTQVTKEERARIAAVFRSTIPNFKHIKKYESLPFYLRNMAWTFMVVSHSEDAECLVLALTCFFNGEPGEWINNTKVRIRFCTHKPVPKHLHKIALKYNAPTSEFASWAAKINRNILLDPDFSFVDDFNTVTYKLYVNTVPRPNETESPEHETSDSNLTSITESNDSNIILKVTKNSQPQNTSTPKSNNSSNVNNPTPIQQSPKVNTSMSNSTISPSSMTLPRQSPNTDTMKLQNPTPNSNMPIQRPFTENNPVEHIMPPVFNTGAQRRPPWNPALLHHNLPHPPLMTHPQQRRAQPNQPPTQVNLTVNDILNKTKAELEYLAAKTNNAFLARLANLDLLSRKIELTNYQKARAQLHQKRSMENTSRPQPQVLNPRPSIHHSYALPPTAAPDYRPRILPPAVHPHPQLLRTRSPMPPSAYNAPLPKHPSHQPSNLPPSPAPSKIIQSPQLHSKTGADQTVQRIAANYPPAETKPKNVAKKTNSAPVLTKLPPTGADQTVLRSAANTPSAETKPNVVEKTNSAPVLAKTPPIGVKSPKVQTLPSSHVRSTDVSKKGTVGESRKVLSQSKDKEISSKTSPGLRTVKPPITKSNTKAKTVPEKRNETLTQSTSQKTSNVTVISNPKEIYSDKPELSEELITIEHCFPPVKSMVPSEPLHAVTKPWPTKTTISNITSTTVKIPMPTTVSSAEISTDRSSPSTKDSCMDGPSENENAINPVTSKLESTNEKEGEKQEVNNNLNTANSEKDICHPQDTQPPTLVKIVLENLSTLCYKDIECSSECIETVDDDNNVNTTNSENDIYHDKDSRKDIQPPTLVQIALENLSNLCYKDIEYSSEFIETVDDDNNVNTANSEKDICHDKESLKDIQPPTLVQIALENLSNLCYKDIEYSSEFIEKVGDDQPLQICDSLVKLCLGYLTFKEKHEYSTSLLLEDDVKKNNVSKPLQDQFSSDEDIQSEDFEVPFFQPPTLTQIALSMLEPVNPKEFELLLSAELSKSSSKVMINNSEDVKIKQPPSLKHIAFLNLSPLFYNYNFESFLSDSK